MTNTVRQKLRQMFTRCLNVAYTTVSEDGDVAIVRNENAVTLYFEHSDGKLDWKNNFTFPAKPYRDMKNIWFCHRGFLKVWKAIEPHVRDVITDTTVTKFDIVGYSHGGALAQLCYEYVKFNRPDVEVTGVGFGAPRVFWGFARKAVTERFNGFIVVRNGKDIVTHLPPVLFGFRHVGTVAKIGESVGVIKDHYPERYIEALSKEEVTSDG